MDITQPRHDSYMFLLPFPLLRAHFCALLIVHTTHKMRSAAMKTTIVIAALAASVACSEISELQAKLPECSIQCLAEGAATHDCGVTDLECQCSKQEAITKTVSPCFVKAGCDLEDITGMFSSSFMSRVSLMFSCTDTASVVNQLCQAVSASANDTSTVKGDGASKTTAAPTTEPTGAAGHVQMVSWLSLVGLAAAAFL